MGATWSAFPQYTFYTQHPIGCYFAVVREIIGMRHASCGCMSYTLASSQALRPIWKTSIVVDKTVEAGISNGSMQCRQKRWFEKRKQYFEVATGGANTANLSPLPFGSMYAAQFRGLFSSIATKLVSEHDIWLEPSPESAPQMDVRYTFLYDHSLL